MITKTEKDNYVLVTSDTGKLRVKGDTKIYSQATEYKDQPREYEEIVEEIEEEETQSEVEE
jgi:hypothetical protein